MTFYCVKPENNFVNLCFFPLAFFATFKIFVNFASKLQFFNDYKKVLEKTLYKRNIPNVNLY